jgi:hypothetical protein
MFIYTGIRTIIRREGYRPNVRLSYRASPPIPVSDREAIWFGVLYICIGLCMMLALFVTVS